MNENELMHYGVLGMKWGKRKDRDKSSFNTKYNHVITDKSGKLLQVNGKSVDRRNRMHRKASRAAIKEMNAYRKSNKKANWKDSLSVAGNKYEETLNLLNKKSRMPISNIAFNSTQLARLATVKRRYKNTPLRSIK